MESRVEKEIAGLLMGVNGLGGNICICSKQNMSLGLSGHAF